MTNEKARDFFSAYHEGTLEPGLSVSLEQKFKADSDLRREYDSFSRAMGELGSLKFEEIEIPFDLHERITARLDRHIYDQKQKPRFAWNAWVRTLAFTGVGAIAIAGAIFAINSRGDGIGKAGPFPTVAPNVDTITMSASSDGVMLKFAPGTLKKVIISDAQGNVQYKRSTVANTLLSNSLPNAAVFGIQLEGDAGVRYVAIPGKMRSSINKGDGTILDLAKAASDYYQIPVSVETGTPNQRESWTFGSTEVVSELGKGLSKSYGVTQLPDMVEIKESK